MHSALIMCTVVCCISILLLSTSSSQGAIMVILHLRGDSVKEQRREMEGVEMTRTG